MKEESITTNIKIANPNREVLKKHFAHCFDKNGHFNFEKLKQELAQDSEVDFSQESYSMDWLGKSYARLLASDEATTLLKEDEAWNEKPANAKSENLLIKGDNLEVLKHLAHAYHEKVKMIYIDPPYNTGNDGFVYQDDRKFTCQELARLAGIEEERAKRILAFTQSKSNSHSAWLTFIYPRLYIAKQLLREDGVIFVSIDDHEVAQLRLVMDEVFGEENFVAALIHQRASGGGQAKHVVKGHDYVLICAKNILQNVNFTRKKKMRGEVIEKNGKQYFIDNDFIRKKFGKYDKGVDRRCFYEELSVYKNKSQIQKINKKLDSGEYFLKKNDKGFNMICRLVLVDDAKSKIYSIINDSSTIKILSEKGKKDLEKLNISVFEYPKPVEFVYFLISSVSVKDDDVILDFFAGSGTTGDAVMQLNAEDGGNRKYILVQLPEEIDPKKSKAAYDFVKEELGVDKPTIFEITKERLVRAGQKIVADNKQAKEPKDLTSQDFGFKIFETRPIWEGYHFDEEKFDPQAKLFDEETLTPADLKTLLTTWKTYDGIKLTDSLQAIDLNGYRGHYFDKKLYLVDRGFSTPNLQKLLEEIDANKDFNPALIIAFGYHFESKVLRELAENVKGYANKKKTDIDFIIRY